MTQAVSLGWLRRVRRASIAFAVLTGVLVPGLIASPASASDPLTFDHIAGRPRHLAPRGIAIDGAGHVFVTDTNSSSTSTDDRVVKYSADGTFLDVIAGPGTGPGFVANPTAIAIAPNGDLYVTEAGNDATGTERVSYFDSGGTYLGSWGAYGIAPGSFKDPKGIAIDSSSTVYVADSSNKRIQVFDATGTHLTDWSLGSSPTGIAVDPLDKVWVTDGNSVTRYNAAGGLLNTWSSSGASGVTVDDDGNGWVTSTANVVREYDASGTLLATVGSGLSGPQGVAMHGHKLYIVDTGNGRVVRYTIPSTPLSWTVNGATGLSAVGSAVDVTNGTSVLPFDGGGNAGTPWASSGSSGTAIDGSGNVWVASATGNVVYQYDAAGNLLQTVGASAPLALSAPRGIAVSGTKLYVADTGNNRVVRFATDGSYETAWTVNGVTGVALFGSTLYAAAGNFVRPYNASSGSAGTSWSSSGATDVATDASGNIWVSSSTGIVSEYTSSRILIGTVGGGILLSPHGLAFANSRLYVADHGNDKVYRFSFSSFDLAWGQYPGNGVEDQPSGVAVDASGNVYTTNRADDKIQKFDANGDFVTEWGDNGSGNGEFVDPVAIAVSPSGAVYVADTGNNRIQRFAADGTYQTQWGSTGSNAAAKQMISPSGIAVDAAGNVYVSDLGNNRVTKFDANGTYLTTWGTQGQGDAQLYEPRGIAIDGTGNVWVADSRNNRIQEFTAGGAFINKWGGSGSGGTSSSALDGKFSRPYDLDIDAQGSVWVADRNNSRIQRLETDGTFLSKLGQLGLDIAQFNLPTGIAVASTGEVVVADTGNNRVQVFIDANGPDTTITGKPASVTNLTSGQFSFTANEPGSTFQCAVDGGGAGPYADCDPGDSFGPFAAGTHTFYVKAFDVEGNPGDPATYQWTIDLTPPVVAIDSGPQNPAANLNANFTYHSSENPSTFLCALDGGGTAACGSSFSGSVVGDGVHTFDVWAVDQAGNVSTNAAEYTWNVDTTPPSVQITDAPPAIARNQNASFSFTSGDPDLARFECRLETGGAWGTCTSPQTYSGLPEGAHSFSVRGVDTNGNIGNAKTHSWSVDLQTHKPDGSIGVAGKFAGDGVYNSTGTNQTKTIKTGSGKTVSFSLHFDNDGSDTDTYTLKGGGSVKGYTVSYFAGVTDYTTKIVAGNYTFSLPPGSTKNITLKVKVGSTGKASWSGLITQTSGHESSKTDAVKAIVKRV